MATSVDNMGSSTLKTYDETPNTLISRVSAWRKRLGLSNPGTFEHLNKEIKQTFLTNYFFDGARADLAKFLSPTFQVSHAFHTGSSVQPAGYSFSSVYANERLLLHGSMDNEYSLSGRCHYQITPGLVSKIQLQIGKTKAQSMLQAEMDYQGEDYSANVKAVNPSPEDATGIFVANYLQSVTPTVALGAECVVQRPQAGIEDAHISYVARWQPKDKNQVATLQLQPGGVSATYWRKIEEKVDAGAEIQLAMGPRGKRDAVCTVGAKWEFASATFRTLVDTKGKVQMLMEERLAPGFGFQIAGELDHAGGKSRFGVALVMDS